MQLTTAQGRWYQRANYKSNPSEPPTFFFVFNDDPRKYLFEIEVMYERGDLVMLVLVRDFEINQGIIVNVLTKEEFEASLQQDKTPTLEFTFDDDPNGSIRQWMDKWLDLLNLPRDETQKEEKERGITIYPKSIDLSGLRNPDALEWQVNFANTRIKRPPVFSCGVELNPLLNEMEKHK